MEKRLGIAFFQEPIEGEPYSYWYSNLVNPDVIRERFERLKNLLDNYYENAYWMATPNGKYFMKE